MVRGALLFYLYLTLILAFAFPASAADKLIAPVDDAVHFQEDKPSRGPASTNVPTVELPGPVKTPDLPTVKAPDVTIPFASEPTITIGSDGEISDSGTEAGYCANCASSGIRSEGLRGTAQNIRKRLDAPGAEGEKSQSKPVK